MFLKKININKILVIAIISLNLLILNSCNHVSINTNNIKINKNKNLGNNSYTSIGPVKLTNYENNLIKVGGASDSYLFKIKNPKENEKSVLFWIDLYENGKLKKTLGKSKISYPKDNKLKYIAIASNESKIDKSKREFIISMLSNTGMDQVHIIDKKVKKMLEASQPNNDQKVVEGKEIDLAAFIQNKNGLSTYDSISKNMKELLKNKLVYIFKCKLEK